MAKYDIEAFLADLKTVLQANLNTAISAISTQKGDGLVLRSIDSNAYALQTLNQAILAYDPFLLFGITKVESDGVGPATGKKYIVPVLITVADQGSDLLIGKRLLRYQRALEDTIESNWDRIGNGMTVRMQSLPPQSFGGTADELQSIGIYFEVTIV